VLKVDYWIVQFALKPMCEYIVLR